MSWQPTASWQSLEKRAQLLERLRAFFAARQILEVDVPAIGAHTVTDVHLEPLVVYDKVNANQGYLQTSPEYCLKRLLVRDQRSVYYLGKAFRSDESGTRHRREFTMLEWYQVGFDDRDLMKEIGELIDVLSPGDVCVHRSYAEVFEAALGVNPHCAEESQLRALAQKHTSFMGMLPGRAAWLDLLFSVCVEPQLGEQPVIVYDFPAEQCALARLATDSLGHTVARRFELYWRGLELANGYWELSDVDEQLARFEADLQMRHSLGLAAREIDPLLMAALKHGLPDCSGVALGVDRLLMCLTGCRDIAQVLTFADE